MDLLPNELRQDILQYLAIDDVKNFRLVSKDFALLGTDFLIKPTFYTLPHRDDFKRLLDLSRHPIFESYIENVVFNLAEMNDYQARHNIYFLNYTREAEIRHQVLSEAWEDYKLLEACKKSFAENYCNAEILKEAFENHTRIKSLEIRMTECPFENQLLRRLWDVPSTQQAHRNLDTERLSTILENCEPLKLETFKHDRLSMDFFRQDQKLLNLQFLGLSNLKHLHLDLTHGAVEENEFHAMMSKFACCLRSIKDLCSLHVGVKRRETHSCMMSPYIVECTWPQLSKLHLSGITVSSVDLIKFLGRHKSSLRIFELGAPRAFYLPSPEFHINEFRGTTGKQFFTLLSQTLDLQQLVLAGNFNFESYEASQDGDSHPKGVEEWKLDESRDDASSLERFVVNGGEWPGVFS